MRKLLPCYHCVTSQCKPRGSSPLTGIIRATNRLSSPSATHLQFSSPSLLSKRHFTLPDLSQFSPFANSPGSSGKGNDDYETYHESVVMPFDKQTLFGIVSNVEEYDKFVPYCVQSKIDSSSQKEIDKDTREFLADLSIGYGQVRESYTSKVTIIDGKSVQVIDL